MKIKLSVFEGSQLLTVGEPYLGIAEEKCIVMDVNSPIEFETAVQLHRAVNKIPVVWATYEVVKQAVELIDGAQVEIIFGNVCHNTAIGNTYCFCSDTELLGLKSF